MFVKLIGFMIFIWKGNYIIWKMKGDFILRIFEMSLEWLKKNVIK